MTTSTKTARRRGGHRSARLRKPTRVALLPLAAILAAGCADRFAFESGTGSDVAQAAPAAQHGPGHDMSASDRATAMLASSTRWPTATSRT